MLQMEKLTSFLMLINMVNSTIQLAVSVFRLYKTEKSLCLII